VGDPTQAHPLMTAQEVAALCGVDTRTVHRWGRTGKLTARRTPGGRLRFVRAEVYAVMGLTPALAQTKTPARW
jgi:excisionase family DNA binding protein